jgi:CheY-like chemotaxis protein
MPRGPILLVDDDENDRILISAALEKIPFDDAPLHMVGDGQAAIDYLQHACSANSSKDPLPSFVLLDLNMPRKNGLEVLKWVRTQPRLASVAFVVLTASLRTLDVKHAFELGAHAFLVKPPVLADLSRMLGCLREWLQINHFPPRNPWIKQP